MDVVPDVQGMDEDEINVPDTQRSYEEDEVVTDTLPMREDEIDIPLNPDGNCTFRPPRPRNLLFANPKKATAVKLQKFITGKELDKAAYKVKGNDPGLVLIFNQERFKNPAYEEREGSRKDVEELILTFGRLKFNVEDRFIFNDLKKNEIIEKIAEICRMDLKERNCLICIFMSHGGEDNKLAVKDAIMSVEEIYKPFSECEDLMDKPKLFVFQACKTARFNASVTEMDAPYVKDIVCNRTLTNEIGPDMLLFYATIEGEVSFRHPRDGSWFIQEFCRNLLGYARSDDIISVIIRTTKCVANNYYYEKNHRKAKQMPIFISTLRKKFFLTQTKQRHLLLSLLEQNRQLNEALKELDRMCSESTALPPQAT